MKQKALNLMNNIYYPSLMSINQREFEMMELAALLIDTNKQFTNALKAKRPHTELVEIYSQIKEIYNQINCLKEQQTMVAA